MTRVTVRDDVRAALGSLATPLELVDESGRTLGFFMPAPADPSGMKVPASDEELARRAMETETYSTAEVLDHLRSL